MAGNGTKKYTGSSGSAQNFNALCLFGARRRWDKKISPGFLLLLEHQTARADALRKALLPRWCSLCVSFSDACTHFYCCCFRQHPGRYGSSRSITTRVWPCVCVCLYGAGHWPGILNISHHLLPKAPHAEILQLLAGAFYGAHLVSHRDAKRKRSMSWVTCKFFSLDKVDAVIASIWRGNNLCQLKSQLACYMQPPQNSLWTWFNKAVIEFTIKSISILSNVTLIKVVK